MEITFRRFSLILLVFLLPWQARYFIFESKLNGVFWEYGTVYVLVWQLLLWLNIFLNFTSIKNFFNSRYAFFAFFGLALSVLSVFSAKLPYISLFYWFHILEAFLIYALIASQKDADRNILTQFFIMSAVVEVFVGLGQFFAQYSPPMTIFGMSEHDPKQMGTSVIEVGIERWLRAYGTLAHPNIFGGFIAVAMMFCARHYSYLWVRFERGLSNFNPAFAMGAWAILSLGLVLSFSKSAWLAVFITLLIIFLKSSFRRRAIAKLFIVLVFMFLLVGLAQPSLMFGRLFQEGRLETMSVQERKISLGVGWTLIKEKIFVGRGLSNYTYTLWEKFPDTIGFYFQPIHNVFLQIWAEGGLITFLFLLFFVFRSLKKLKPLMILFFVLGMFDHYLVSLPFGLYLVSLSFGLNTGDKELEDWAVLR